MGHVPSLYYDAKDFYENFKLNNSSFKSMRKIFYVLRFKYVIPCFIADSKSFKLSKFLFRFIKQFKEKYGVRSVRDNLTQEQVKLLDELQIADTVFCNMGFDYSARKILLTAHKEGNAQEVLREQVMQMLPVSSKAS